MHDAMARFGPAAKVYPPADNPRFVKLHRRFPTVAYLRRHARRNVPSFAFEYMDGGAGADGGIARNWSALDAVELVPRYGVTTALLPGDIDLFGRHHPPPVGAGPMERPSSVWPAADHYIAAARHRARGPGCGRHRIAVPAGRAHARRHSGLARLSQSVVETGETGLRHSKALRRRHRKRG